MIRVTIAAAAAALSLASVAHAQEHVVNGGFTTGDFTGFSESDPYGGDINLVGVDGAYPHTEPYSAYFGTEYDATFGNPTDYIDLSQSFGTVAGQTYTFSFWLSNGGDFDLGPSPTNSVSASFEGSTLLSISNQPSSLYQQYSYSVTATGASSTIAFRFSNIESYWNLDDVSVTDETPTGDVPEPASWAMMITGFGLTGAALRSARRAVALG